MRPLGRDHHGTNLGVAAHRGHRQGKVVPQVHAHGVARLGPVQPHRCHVFVLLDAEHRRVEVRDVCHMDEG